MFRDAQTSANVRLSFSLLLGTIARLIAAAATRAASDLPFVMTLTRAVIASGARARELPYLHDHFRPAAGFWHAIRACHRTVDGQRPEPAQIVWTSAGLVDAADLPLAGNDGVVRTVLVDPGAEAARAELRASLSSLTAC